MKKKRTLALTGIPYDAMASYHLRPAIGLQLNLYNLTNELHYDAGRMRAPAPGRAVSVTTSLKF